jgi:valyl-tRNA synthetase
MNDKFLKPYNPLETEPRIYKMWEESGFFNPDNLPERHKEPYTIIMPPPNANGSLHVGHAAFVTLEDLIIRFKRMQGFKTLWLPGADHAGFETQVVYEKKLEKEGRSRFGMDPEILRSEIMDFTLGNKKFMEGQIRQLGASCDWSREKFTLDPDIIKIVYDTFKKLSDDKLLYRGKRIVNWCTKHQTSLSDLECASVEQNDKLYYMKYGPFIVATVRPETIFGDVAIAVNPNDERYKKYIGTDVVVKNPIGELTLKVIADEVVEIEFGTGALKVTPAHDANDFKLAEKNNLPIIEVIDKNGRLNEKTGKYSGMKIKEAREKVVADLEAMGLMEKIEDYKHSVSTCYKCNSTLEPRVMPQWFVDVKPLAKKVIEVISNNEISFVPERYNKICTQWLENIIPWNISRQIVWGIPIPAKICDTCEEGIVDIENLITKCPKCGGDVKKETDTFDTWFSSGQWPFATLGYPDKKDYKSFYPTAVMETAADIVFFWVMRMSMFGIYRTGQVPFKTVYLHGLVNDKHGKKMSKSKGNVVNPLEISDKFGTDAMRIGLIIGNTPASDVSFSDDKIRGYKNFANKVWNITRFVLTSCESFDVDSKPEISITDQKILDELDITIKDITTDIDEYRLYIAAEKIYHYIWHTFADIIIEGSKSAVNGEDVLAKKSAQYSLYKILTVSLKLLHPFMPFVTEEIWGSLPHKDKKMLMVENWPA